MAPYFVGHLIEDSRAEYYGTLTADLAKRFGIEDLSKRIPAHLTLKPPFSPEDLSSFKREVEELATGTESLPLRISGFGRFGMRTIFLDIEADASLQNAAESVARSLGAPIRSNPLHLHVSVARHLDQETFKDVWEYVQELPRPEFDTRFDNLTLFKKTGREWAIEERYSFLQAKS